MAHRALHSQITFEHRSQSKVLILEIKTKESTAEGKERNIAAPEDMRA